ncbi:MAG TPA: ankyrin repeat domain-containing protein, partial [Chthonomonadaceae bacterium]|nr:ankyrin repeat domain-containing protein [Chthonomonadaceae bacterium]
NRGDTNGDTPLILTARYSGDVETARALREAGAQTNVKNARGMTAVDSALARGRLAFARALGYRPQGSVSVDAKPLAERARMAVERGLPPVELATLNFINRSGCVSCHHQGVGLMVTAMARDHGYQVDKSLTETQVKSVTDFIDPSAPQLRGILDKPELHGKVPTAEIGEYVPFMAYVFNGLLEQKVPTRESISCATVIMASQQREDGRFSFTAHREPMQSTDITTTAFCIRLLQTYMPADRADDVARRIGKARDWLIASHAITTDDLAFRLLGLKWAGAPPQEIDQAAAALRKAQHGDGGWSQFQKPRFTRDAYACSDAYATGEALYALNQAGASAPSDAYYQRGVRFLLDTQDDDGTWFVQKRATPLNIYLDAGFPNVESQYISYTASCWANMALMLAADQPALAQAVRR